MTVEGVVVIAVDDGEEAVDGSGVGAVTILGALGTTSGETCKVGSSEDGVPMVVDGVDQGRWTFSLTASKAADTHRSEVKTPMRYASYVNRSTAHV